MSRLKPKIVFVGSFRPTLDGRGGGQLTACRNLVAATNTDIDWICVDTTQTSIVPPAVTHRLVRGISRIAGLAKRLLCEKPDAVLVFSSTTTFSLLEKGAMVLLCRLLGRKCMLSLRSNIKEEMGLPDKAILKSVAAISSLILVQSDLVKAKLETSYEIPAGRIQVLRNMHPQGLNIESAPKAEADGAVVILFAGWLEPVKGVEYLIEAVAGLRNEGLTVQLQLCGSGSEKETLTALVESHGLTTQVHFLGWLESDQLYALMRKADIFCLPSLSEGQPNAVLEAMCHGLPIVASSVDGVRAIVTHQQTGLLVEPGSVMELKNALQKVTEDSQLRRRFGAAASEYVQHYHSPETVAESFSLQIKRLL